MYIRRIFSFFFRCRVHKKIRCSIIYEIKISEFARWRARRFLFFWFLFHWRLCRKIFVINNGGQGGNASPTILIHADINPCHWQRRGALKVRENYALRQRRWTSFGAVPVPRGFSVLHPSRNVACNLYVIANEMWSNRSHLFALSRDFLVINKLRAFSAARKTLGNRRDHGYLSLNGDKSSGFSVQSRELTHRLSIRRKLGRNCNLPRGE